MMRGRCFVKRGCSPIAVQFLVEHFQLFLLVNVAAVICWARAKDEVAHIGFREQRWNAGSKEG